MTKCPFFLRDCDPNCLDYTVNECRMIERFHMNGTEYIDGLKNKAPEFLSGKLIAVRAGDPILSAYGWTAEDFAGHLVIDGKMIWMSSIWSKHPGAGNLSRLVKNLHKAGYTLNGFAPYPRMEAIVQRMGFTKTVRYVPELNKPMALYTLFSLVYVTSTRRNKPVTRFKIQICGNKPVTPSFPQICGNKPNTSL